MKVIKKSIVTKVIELEAAKRERERLDQHIADLQSAILTQLDGMGQKSMTVELEDRNIKVTKVQGVRVTIDELSLKKRLGAKTWDQVSTRVLDKKKLEANIASGDVDPIAVAECTTETPNKPYVKLTS
jgi:hypothetical protein